MLAQNFKFKLTGTIQVPTYHYREYETGWQQYMRQYDPYQFNLSFNKSNIILSDWQLGQVYTGNTYFKMPEEHRIKIPINRNLENVQARYRRLQDNSAQWYDLIEIILDWHTYPGAFSELHIQKWDHNSEYHIWTKYYYKDKYVEQMRCWNGFVDLSEESVKTYKNLFLFLNIG